MADQGLKIFPYISFRRWHDPRSGLRRGVAPPMISQGYTAIQNRPGLLIETHMLKPYRHRVRATYEMIRCSLEILNKTHRQLKELNRKADEFTASPEFRKKKQTVKFRLSEEDPVAVPFEGVEYEIETSDLTGGPWIKYDAGKPKTYILPLYHKNLPETEVALPEAYIIPPEWTDVISRLELHGVRVARLKQPAEIAVRSYRFHHYEWRATPYEGCQMLSDFDMDDIEDVRTFPAGSAVVDMNQRTARVIAHILEPGARDSYVSWGFFNPIFEQKEYAETYVMEKTARQMMKENPGLRDLFEKYLEENPGVKGRQWEMLNWFYMRSAYGDPHKDLYPVGRIYSRKVLNNLSLDDTR
jgi:hypothetical protein